ncbi:MAG: glycine cleavage system aminomethyltransferase GcvT [Bacteroidetes bacterium]|nr:glycine cleavage system aminomethyltransferase GcvT [Bacteroidota bacterium]
MKQTALTQLHKDLGAKMAEFAGYEMPIVYTSQVEEHNRVRNSVGVFDVSHMGEFVLKGAGAAALIQKVTSNDVYALSPGKAQYSCLPNENGGIVDDLLVYHLEDGNYMLVVNAGNIDKDWNHIVKYNTDGVDMVNISDDTSLLAVQGPKALETLQKLTDVNLSEIAYYTFTKHKFAGIGNVIISATGYTGAGGFEIYFPKEHSLEIWNKIFEAGKEFDIQPIGLAARDTLRLEMGFCLYGNDIDDTTSPLEAGLGWITKMKATNNDFVGKDKIAAGKEAGLTRKLVGFEMVDRGIPRHDYPIVDENNNVIGKVTSGTQSPSLNKAIGLGYVTLEKSTPDSEIFIDIRQKPVKAKVVKIPFLTNN